MSLQLMGLTANLNEKVIALWAPVPSIKATIPLLFMFIYKREYGAVLQPAVVAIL